MAAKAWSVALIVADWILLASLSPLAGAVFGGFSPAKAFVFCFLFAHFSRVFLYFVFHSIWNELKQLHPKVLLPCRHKQFSTYFFNASETYCDLFVPSRCEIIVYFLMFSGYYQKHYEILHFLCLKKCFLIYWTFCFNFRMMWCKVIKLEKNFKFKTS